MWEVGQAYTALSRGVTLRGVHVPADGLQRWAKQTFQRKVHNVDLNVHTKFAGGGRPADPVFHDAQPAADGPHWLSKKRCNLTACDEMFDEPDLHNGEPRETAE